MDQRLYRITLKGDPGDQGRLVSAQHPAQALRHVASDTFEISLPSALQTAQLVKLGVEVEDANRQEPADEQATSPQPAADPGAPPF